MKRALLLLAASSFLVLACEDKKEKEKELLDRVGIEAGAPTTATASVTGVNVVPPPGSVTVAAKPPKDCGTGDPVIDDKDLEAELRLKTKPPKESGALTSKDLATIISVNLTKKTADLTELDPCVFPKLAGLKFLYLGKGTYRDLSPIKDLIHIEGLRVSISEVEDLKPLEKLTALDQLDIGRTHVRDLSPLANNVNITELSLDDTQVSDISVLAKLKKLQKLSIKNTLVKDVSALKDLTKLRTLDVGGCAIDNINLLEPLKAKGLRVSTK